MNNEEFAQKNTCCLKKVLVTGASGFIGSFLVEGGLEREMQVCCLLYTSPSPRD